MPAGSQPAVEQPVLDIVQPALEDEEATPVTRLVYDYANQTLVDEADMPVGSERWAASERAYWQMNRRPD